MGAQCSDTLPGPGDLRTRQQHPVICTSSAPSPTAVPVSTPSRDSDPVDGPTGSASDSESPRPESTPTAASTPSVSAPRASLRVGDRSSAGAGTYVLWIKAENHVYLVRKGVVTRSMLTTAEPWKTPVGDYRIQYKVRHAASTEDGINWYIPNFLSFYQRPGATGTIGFHQIPWDTRTRKPAQPVSTLGLPGYHSHGCARLAPADSEAVYSFAREGTRVKVR